MHAPHLASGFLAALALGLAGCSDPNDPKNVSALLEAATNGDTASVKNLLERGVDPEIANEIGVTPLCAAAQGGNAPRSGCSCRRAPIRTRRPPAATRR